MLGGNGAMYTSVRGIAHHLKFYYFFIIVILSFQPHHRSMVGGWLFASFLPWWKVSPVNHDDVLLCAIQQIGGTGKWSNIGRRWSHGKIGCKVIWRWMLIQANYTGRIKRKCGGDFDHHLFIELFSLNVFRETWKMIMWMIESEQQFGSAKRCFRFLC